MWQLIIQTALIAFCIAFVPSVLAAAAMFSGINKLERDE